MKQRIQDVEILSAEDKEACDLPRVTEDKNTGKSRKLYIESYGCQMNFSDSEIVMSIMLENGFDTTSTPENADVIFLNTCSIRDNAEQKVRFRLKHFNGIKRRRPALMVGILGCMAERLKTKLLEEEKIVDMVVGPDAYRSLPSLITEVDEGHKAVNVYLSREETYADISPVRLTGDGLSAYVSIMRGCDNMCSFCVVPFTRGRERSRDTHTIVQEAHELFNNGYREITLLGQNVDSYKWESTDKTEHVNFAQLLEKVALVNSDLRIRFSTSHPKDITDEVLHTIAKYENICNYIHLPAQSGNNRILERMNRNYTREYYLERIDAIKRIVGDDCGISTDIITGFCGETEEEHQDTMALMDQVVYDYAYMFAYSERPGTPAAKSYADDVPEDVKSRRLSEIIALHREAALLRNKRAIGTTQKILIDGVSKRSEDYLRGRCSNNALVLFPKTHHKKGEYVMVYINDCSSSSLFGEVVA